MARARGEIVVQDAFGNFVPNASVDLLDVVTKVRIPDTVFADASSATTLTLPLTTDSYGRRTFYLTAPGKDVLASYAAAGGTYTEIVGVVDSTASAGAGGIPSGPAGGDLTGTFPNPQIAAGAASGTKLGTDVVTLTGAQTLTNKVLGAGTTLPAGSATGAVLGTDVATLTGVQVLTNKTLSTGTVLPNGIATGAVLGADVELVAHKGAASGYPSLDAFTKITATQQHGSGLRRTFDSFCSSTGGSGKNNATPTPTLATQTAAWQAAQAWSDASGGGLIEFEATGLGAVMYDHLPQLEEHMCMGIDGAGMFASHLRFDSTVTTHAIINHVSTNGTTDPNAIGCSVRNVFLDCGQMPGWGTNVASGVFWNKNPQFGNATNDVLAPFGDTETHHRVENVYIYAPPRDGVESGCMGGQSWFNVQCYSPGRHGFTPTFDSWYSHLLSAYSRNHGLNIGTAPLLIENSKAFSSGNVSPHTGASAGDNFHIAGSFNGGIQLVNVEAQDGWNYGFYCNGDAVSISNLTADSNGVASAGAYTGVFCTGLTNAQIQGVCFERHYQATDPQKNALELAASCNHNTIRLHHSSKNAAVIGPPIRAIDAGSVTNDIAMNDYLAMQKPAFGAAYAPDLNLGGVIRLGVITANLVVAAPVNGPYPIGTMLTLILQENAVGAFTIGWNAIYVNTPASNTGANAYTIGRFRWDGTSWIGV